LFRCFLEHVHYDASLAGTRMRHGRLPVPVFLVLDEVTRTVSQPLAQWLADSAGKGILISFVCHSTGQLRERYGDHAANAIWSLAGTKLFLPGISDPATLDDASKLCGTVQSGDAEQPVCLPELLRTPPDNRALVISMNRAAPGGQVPAHLEAHLLPPRPQPAPPARLREPEMIRDWDELAAQLEHDMPAFADAEPVRVRPGATVTRLASRGVSPQPGPGPAERDDDHPAR
jgi:hypothetical protein